MKNPALLLLPLLALALACGGGGSAASPGAEPAPAPAPAPVPGSLALVVSPPSATCLPGLLHAFLPTFQGADGVTVPVAKFTVSAVWEETGTDAGAFRSLLGGTIPVISFRTPSTTGPATLRVTAEVDGALTAPVRIPLTLAAGDPTQPFQVTPSLVQVAPGASLTFMVKPVTVEPTAYAFSLTPTDPAGGTAVKLSDRGFLYTAPSTPGTYTLELRNPPDPTVVTATVTVVAPGP